MKKLCVVVFFYCISQSVTAQIGVGLKNYRFKETPIVSQQEDTLYKKDGLVALYYGRVLDYRNEDEGVELWECYHLILKVYDYDKMEKYKKLYIPTSNEENIINCQARCIKKNGEIIQLTKKDITEIVEDNDTNKYLVLTSAETEDIMEFFYVVRKTSVMESSSYYFPGNFPIKKAEFTMIMPDYLKAEFSLYNIASTLIDTVFSKKDTRYSYVTAENLPKISDEDETFVDAYEPRIEFVIAYNYTRGNGRLNTISSYSSSLYDVIAVLEKEELSLIKKFASKIPINKKMTTTEKIQTIENYVKKQIVYIDFNGTFLSDLTFALKVNMTNTLGMAKIYYYLFKYYKIENQVVFTTNKTNKAFDKKFEGPNFLQEIMFYFPEIKQFVAPDFKITRLGLTPSVLSGQEAIFFETVTVGKLTSFVPSYKLIPVLPKETSGDTLMVKVRVDKDKKIVKGHVHRVMTGYFSAYVQNSISTMEDEEKEEILDHYLGLGTESITLENVELTNTNPEDINMRPLIMDADLIDYYLPKFEGDKIIVTVGALIGKQKEFKQERKRVLPIERVYKSHYYRTIVCDIPEGYVCTNYDKITSAVYDTDNASNANAAFIVHVKKEGNTIVIVCEEYYDILYYPAEDYQKNAKVVNAAAAFNHVALIFEKQ